MPAKWHKYSYTAQLQERRKLVSFLVLLAILAAIVTLVHTNLVSMYLFESPTMQPTITAGEYVIATPLYDSYLRKDNGLTLRITPSRGDLVIIDPAYTDDLNPLARAFNALVSFASFRKIVPFSSSLSGGERQTIRRLIAFPGDSLYMENFMVHVKAVGTPHYLTEYEQSSAPYELQMDALPKGWPLELPFSGSFPEITLGANEFFVMADNRTTSSDSRTWGPVSADRIRSKILLRYWPFSRFGKP